MVPCSVWWYYSALAVKFDDGSSIILQTDWDQAAFCVNCGLFTSEQLEGWNGAPSSLGDAWADCDPSEITECPEEYMDGAMVDPAV